MTDPRRLAELDAQARERALDPTRSILLQAPAGSGKTSVLTQRFLRLLSIVNEPEEILAITFTRKAAGEMRERVFRALQAQSPADSSPNALRTFELARAAQERSRARGWSLETSPGRLRIQTIDSLNRSIASQLPISARAIGDLAVIERPLSLYRLAARRTLVDADNDPDLQEDIERLFDRLDNEFGRFERLLTAMLQVRSQWLPHLLRSEPEELCERVQESLKAIIAERLEKAAAVIPVELITQGMRLAQEAAARRNAENDANQGPWRVWLDAPVELHAELTLRHWKGLCQLALTEQGTWRATLTKREGFPATEKALKAAGLQWIADMRSVRGAGELLNELADLPEPFLSEDDSKTLESLARLLRLAAAELQVVFQEAGRVDYPYIAAAARRALAEAGAPTDLGLKLGNEIRHILVDEFQDTSIEQVELLEALTAGWDDGDGRTLFVVGDPMQSIYQFREAEVGLFLRTRERGLGSLRLEALALTRNFRAAPGLVDWINTAFPKVFPALDEPRASAVRYHESVASRTDAPPGRVHLHRTSPGDDAGEAKRIAEIVLTTRASEPDASIAILVTARSHAAPIVEALQRADIPVTGVDLVSLAELSVIRDLVALTRALDHLADRTAWMAMLRAPWCGLTLRELVALVGEGSALTVWEAINDGSRLACLEPASRARVERVRRVLADAFAEREGVELARWIESTWLRLGGPATCTNDEDVDHARAFFDRLATWSAEPDWAGPLSVEERLSELYAVHSPAPGAVQIMTIHHAKGLEFDIVIVPGLGKKLRANTEPLFRWFELPREPHGSDLLMAPIPHASRRGMEPLNEYLKSLQNRRMAHERARLLYVAATRARSELHLFGELPEPTEKQPNPGPPSGTLLATLWPAIAADFPAAPERSDIPEQTTPVTECTLTRLPADWSLPEIEAGPRSAGIAVASYEPTSLEDDRAAPDGDGSQCVARAVAEQLRRYARQGGSPRTDQLSALDQVMRERITRMGLVGADLERCAGKAAEALAACLQDTQWQWLFSREHRQFSSPLELTGVYEGRLTSVCIDISFVDREGARWLVSIFSSVTETDDLERFRAQLEKQAALMSQMEPVPIRAAVYFPLLRSLREIALSSAERTA